MESFVYKLFNTNAYPTRPLVAISACLAGHAVRYDGTDKTHQLIAEQLLPKIDIVPLCPEAGAGLGVPRPPVQLVQIDEEMRARGRDNPQLDVTEALTAFAHAQIPKLSATPDLCGHIFKSRSPSCGLGSTPVFGVQNQISATGNGLYAGIIASRLPWLVLCEESQLDSPTACGVFFDKLLLVQSLQLAAGQQELPAAHQHYDFLWQKSAAISALENFAKHNDWRKYSAELLRILPEF